MMIFIFDMLSPGRPTSSGDLKVQKKIEGFHISIPLLV